MNAIASEEIAALEQLAIARWRGDVREDCIDCIAAETPVALEYNGVSHAVMLASPADLEDFAIGFSLSEGIVDARDEIYACESERVDAGIRVALNISTERFAALKERRRTLAGRTGCGLCGVDSLAQVRRELKPVTSDVCIDAAALHRAFAELQHEQRLQHATGATHAAAWIDASGDIVCLREDIGRHNALDKLIGALAQRRADFASGAVLLTSRASSEMVQKAAAVGIGFIAAISGTTTLAVDIAAALDVTLVGFVRPGSHVAYAHPRRLLHGA